MILVDCCRLCTVAESQSFLVTGTTMEGFLLIVFSYLVYKVRTSGTLAVLNNSNILMYSLLLNNTYPRLTV
jgi:hypothetical protein